MINLATIMTATTIAIMGRFSITKCGLTSIPRETKKRAPKVSRRGTISAKA
ncbi:hypothetical protein ES703_111338 [subsurface metagenome]